MTTDTLNQAIELIRQGKTLGAQPMLRELTANEPHNIPAWFWYVETLSSSYERIRVLKQCLAQNPDNQQVKDALDYLVSMNSKDAPLPTENTNIPGEHTNRAASGANRSTKFTDFFTKRLILLIVAGAFTILAIINHLPLFGNLMPGASYFPSLIIMYLLIALSNPFLVGFLHTAYFYRGSNATEVNGALEGALAAVLMVGIRETVLVGADMSEAFIYMVSALMAGAFSGAIVILWKNRRTAKENIKFLDAENTSLNTDWANGLFYLSYVFIVLGGITTTALIFYLEPDVVGVPLPYLFFILQVLIGPFVQALIICTILGKLYRNVLSGAANLLASLFLCIGAVWVVLSTFPSTTGNNSLWNLIFVVVLFVGHFLILTITIGLGWIIKSLSKTLRPAM